MIDLTDAPKNQEIISVSKNEVAQCFSHFSHHYSRGNIVICDLQGVYNASKKRFFFTDPVIHYHNARKDHHEGRYGRTDMGQKGIDLFTRSHNCNKLCELVCSGFLNVPML